MVAMYVSANHAYVGTLLYVANLFCDNTVLMAWLGSGTKTTWLGLEKDVLA